MPTFALAKIIHKAELLLFNAQKAEAGMFNIQDSCNLSRHLL